jgi:hypothetical protein
MLYGRVKKTGADELTLTIYATGRKRRRLAVVIGSAAYIELALAAVGLGRPALTEHRDWRQGTFIRSQPANRHAKRFR